MSSASTQWADVGWYTNCVPGSKLSFHSAKRCEPALTRSTTPAGRAAPPGTRDVCSITCSTVMASLPLVPNSGM